MCMLVTSIRCQVAPTATESLTPGTPVSTPCRAHGPASSAGKPFQNLKCGGEASPVVLDLEIESDDAGAGES